MFLNMTFERRDSDCDCDEDSGRFRELKTARFEIFVFCVLNVLVLSGLFLSSMPALLCP